MPFIFVKTLRIFLKKSVLLYCLIVKKLMEVLHDYKHRQRFMHFWQQLIVRNQERNKQMGINVSGHRKIELKIIQIDSAFAWIDVWENTMVTITTNANVKSAESQKKKKRVESLQSEWWRCRKVVRLLQVRELNERIYCIVFETVQRRWRM